MTHPTTAALALTTLPPRPPSPAAARRTATTPTHTPPLTSTAEYPLADFYEDNQLGEPKQEQAMEQDLAANMIRVNSTSVTSTTDGCDIIEPVLPGTSTSVTALRFARDAKEPRAYCDSFRMPGNH